MQSYLEKGLELNKVDINFVTCMLELVKQRDAKKISSKDIKNPDKYKLKKIKGKLTGSLKKRTKDEKSFILELLMQGKDVDLNPPKGECKVFDFYIDGVKTELKTMNTPNINSAIGKVQHGFKQGAEVVIIDTRKFNISIDQAEEIAVRAARTYKEKVLPGNLQVWTNEGIYEV